MFVISLSQLFHLGSKSRSAFHADTCVHLQGTQHLHNDVLIDTLGMDSAVRAQQPSSLMSNLCRAHAGCMMQHARFHHGASRSSSTRCPRCCGARKTCFRCHLQQHGGGVARQLRFHSMRLPASEQTAFPHRRALLRLTWCAVARRALATMQPCTTLLAWCKVLTRGYPSLLLPCKHCA